MCKVFGLLVVKEYQMVSEIVGQATNNNLGITLGKGPVEEIELWFSKTMAPYIKTQHLHHTQKTVHEDETGLIITLKLIPNPVLTQLILSYGAEITVLKPKALERCLSVYSPKREWFQLAC